MNNEFREYPRKFDQIRCAVKVDKRNFCFYSTLQYHEHASLYRFLATRTSDGKIGFFSLVLRGGSLKELQQPQCARRPRIIGSNGKNVNSVLNAQQCFAFLCYS